MRIELKPGTEVFGIPFRGKTIIYAPLKRIAFMANRTMATLVRDLLDGRVPAGRATLDKLPSIVHFLARHTGAKRVQIEPVFRRGRGRSVAITARHARAFARGFCAALDVAAAHGLELSYSGARPDILTTRFCLSTCEALVVLQTGEVSTCFEVHNVHHPLARHFLVGRLQDGQLELDRRRWLRLANRTGDVKCVCFSPDGKAIASASADHTIKLWDVGTRALVQGLPGHTWMVNSVVFSGDGRRLVSCGEEGRIKLWDISKAKELKILEEQKWGLFCVALSPDGRLIASGGYAKALKIWDATTAKNVKSLGGHEGNVLSSIPPPRTRVRRPCPFTTPANTGR